MDDSVIARRRAVLQRYLNYQTPEEKARCLRVDEVKNFLREQKRNSFAPSVYP